jgi:D-alanyl-D-alanine carboxypeptidase
MHLGRLRRAVAASAVFALVAVPALATPSLVIDVDSGQVLYEHDATLNWYPASLTKLMTVYVALSAVRDGRVTLDTPFVMSQRAASMAPTKMGFRPGVQVTLDNALKMLMVKSPNDIAVMIAEGVSGSVEGFADEMNATAAKLGLKESHFVNPNGLPDTRQVSSARDMAMIGRALFKEFPDEAGIFDIGALQLGNEIIPTHNGLIGRYPGADGMKTGFTCAAGFNVVASATHGGRRLITVVLGSPTPRERTAKAIALFERGFSQSSGGLLNLFGGGSNSGGVSLVDNLPSPGVGPAPDMHGSICSARGRAAALAAEEEDMRAAAPVVATNLGATRGISLVASAAASTIDPEAMAAMPASHFDPVVVFVGPKPGWTGPVAMAKPSLSAPESASAYAASSETAPAQGAEAAPATTAPMALQGVVHTPAKHVSLVAPRKEGVKKFNHVRPVKQIAVVGSPKKPALHEAPAAKAGKQSPASQ